MAEHSNDSFQLYVDSLDSSDSHQPSKSTHNPFVSTPTPSIDIPLSSTSKSITANPFVVSQSPNSFNENSVNHQPPSLIEQQSSIGSFNKVWQDFNPLKESSANLGVDYFQSNSVDLGFFLEQSQQQQHQRQQEDNDSDDDGTEINERDVNLVQEQESNPLSQFFSIDTFMIWNDPESISYNTRIEQLKQQSDRDSGEYSKLNTAQQQKHRDSSSSSSLSSGSNLTNPNQAGAMNVVKKRGLFSRSTRNSNSSVVAAAAAAAAASTQNSGLVTVALNTPSSGDGSALDGFDLSPSSGHHKSQTNISSKSNGNASGTGGATGELDEDRFNGDGVQFQGKLIGHEYVAEARGEQMCQQSLKKLKIIQKALGGHKQRINLYISFDGIKIMDGSNAETLFHHTVPQISFISRDETDTRAFGYVFGNSTTGHQFIGIKTKKEAMVVMSTIGQLFAITLKRKRNAEESAALAASAGSASASAVQQLSTHSRPESSSSSALPSIGANEDSLHMYHSVYDIGSGTGINTGLNDNVSGSSLSSFVVPPPQSLTSGTGTSGRSNRRHRNATNILSNLPTIDTNVPIPVLPPPSSSHLDHHHSHNNNNRRHHHNHQQQQPQHNHHNHSLSQLPGSQPGLASSTNHQHTYHGTQTTPNNLLSNLDMFGSGMDPASGPIAGAAISTNLNQNQKTTFDWANFDDDNSISFGGGASGTGGAAAVGGGSLQHLQYQQHPNSVSQYEDSTLNTISSISDANLNLSSLTSSSTLNLNQQNLQQQQQFQQQFQQQSSNNNLNSQSRGPNPNNSNNFPNNISSLSTSSQNDSSTLVARYNQKNLPKNSSSSTIASSNFDGVDPFSDAFGTGDDPFQTTGLSLDSSIGTIGTGSQLYSVPKADTNNSQRSVSRNAGSNLDTAAAANHQMITQSSMTNNIIVPPPNAVSISATGQLPNQFGKISLNSSGSLDKSIGGSGGGGGSTGSSFKSSHQFNQQKESNDPLSNSGYSNRSIDSTSSADRYACLADIHSISTSIFDSFGSSGGAVGGASGTANNSNSRQQQQQQQQPVVAAQSSSNLFGSSSFSTSSGQSNISAQQQQQQHQQQQFSSPNLFGSIGNSSTTGSQPNSSTLFCSGPSGFSSSFDPNQVPSQFPPAPSPFNGSPIFASKRQQQPQQQHSFSNVTGPAVSSQLSQWSTSGGGGSTSSIASLPNFNSTSSVSGPSGSFGTATSQQQLFGTGIFGDFGTGTGGTGGSTTSSSTLTSITATAQPILFQELDPLGSINKAVSSGSLVSGSTPPQQQREKPSYFMEPKQRQQFSGQLDHSLQRNYSLKQQNSESNISTMSSAPSSANSSASNTPPPPPLSSSQSTSRRPRFALKDQSRSLPSTAGGGGGGSVDLNSMKHINENNETSATGGVNSSIESSSSRSLIVSLPPPPPAATMTTQSLILKSGSSLKFETTFDDDDEDSIELANQDGATVDKMVKQPEESVIEINDDEDDDDNSSSVEEFDDVALNRKLSSISTNSSITQRSSSHAATTATTTSVPSRPALSRQSSREPTTTPPIPPRTDLLQHQQSNASSSKYRFGQGPSSSGPLPPAPPPPPPPPYSLPKNPQHSYQQQQHTPPPLAQQPQTGPYHNHPLHYPPLYGPYGPAGYSPQTPDPYISSSSSEVGVVAPRRYNSPNRYVGGSAVPLPPLPTPPPPSSSQSQSQWHPHAHQSAYEYLYQDPVPPIPPPYYRTMDPAAYHPHPHHYPMPPPPHPFHDFYRQSPYHQSPLYPDQNPYGWLPGGDPYYHGGHPHHQAPPPPPPSHPQHMIYETLKSSKAAASTTTSTPGSNCSTPPPTQMGGPEASSTPPLAPPLPNPQRRISSTSLQEQRFGSGTGMFYGMGRSNSSASNATAPSAVGDPSSAQITPRTPPIYRIPVSSSQYPIPSYFHQHHPHQYDPYGAIEMSRFEYPEESSQQQPDQQQQQQQQNPPPLPPPNPVRKSDSLLQIAVSPSTSSSSATTTTNAPASGATSQAQQQQQQPGGCLVASFNAGMEQMIMKYQYGTPSPLLPSTGSGSLYSPIYPIAAHHHAHNPHFGHHHQPAVYSGVYSQPQSLAPQAASSPLQPAPSSGQTSQASPQPQVPHNSSSISSNSSSGGSSSGYSTQSHHQKQQQQQQLRSNPLFSSNSAIYPPSTQQQLPALVTTVEGSTGLQTNELSDLLYDLPATVNSMKPLWDCSIDDDDNLQGQQQMAPQQQPTQSESNNFFDDNFDLDTNSGSNPKINGIQDDIEVEVSSLKIQKDTGTGTGNKDSNNNNEVDDEDSNIQQKDLDRQSNGSFLELDTIKLKQQSAIATPSVGANNSDTLLLSNSSSSPPERNIFLVKEDPFEDDFFKS